jgi:hypothetical protein
MDADGKGEFEEERRMNHRLRGSAKMVGCVIREE